MLTVKPLQHPSNRDYFRAAYHCPVSHKKRFVTRATLADLKEAAFEAAQGIQRGTLDLNLLAPHQIRNIRAAWVTFFLGCRGKEYLPHNQKTAPERLDKPIVSPKIPATYTPEELAILLQHVQPKFLPWLAVSAFAGVRNDEFFPLRNGSKSPLDWSDFHWDRDIIIIRPETDKNGYRRVVPILPALRAWLFPLNKKSGPLSIATLSSGKYSETKRVEAFIGGWKQNALRHSYISYRAAEVGLAQTAMECGKSESEARKS